MRIFLDSANLDDAHQAWALGFVDGVTTNPSLMAATARPPLEVLEDLLEITSGPVFFQTTAPSAEERKRDAVIASNRDKERVVIKLPSTTENMTLAQKLSDDGLQVCITAVSHPSQAMLAGKVGAAYIAPYVNRLSHQMGDGVKVVRDCVKVLEGTSTQVLAASLKSTDEAVAAVIAGATAITTTLELIMALSEHEFTNEAIAQFDVASKMEKAE